MAMSSALLPLLAFVFIVTLIPVTLWLMRRSGLGGAPRDASLMRSIGALALSPSQRVVIVEVGSGSSARWMLLGVSAERIVPLMMLDAPPTAVESSSHSAPETMVEQLISRWRTGRQGDGHAH